MGSIGAPWFAPVRNAVPLVPLVAFVLMLPALGVALVKPSVVGTTARASKENVRSVGYSIYYTLVNVGSTAGPLLASWIQGHGGASECFSHRGAERVRHAVCRFAAFQGTATAPMKAKKPASAR